MTPMWLAVFIVGGGFGSVIALFAIWLCDWIKHERQTGDPIEAWDQTQQPGLYVFSSSSESDRDICDAWIAARLAHEHRAGANG